MPNRDLLDSFPPDVRMEPPTNLAFGRLIVMPHQKAIHPPTCWLAYQDDSEIAA